MFRLELEGLKDFLVSWDPGARAAYVKLAQGRVSEAKQEGPGVYVDIGSGGKLLGLEILNPKSLKLTIMHKIARKYSDPRLKKFNPRALPRVFATS